MKSVVIYTTRYGSTAEVAGKLAGACNADLIDLAKTNTVNLEQYDVVFLGSPIFSSNLAGKMKKFCDENSTALLNKRLYLFICCAHEGEEARKQIDVAWPEQLVAHAADKTVLGGAVILEKYNFLIRALMKKLGIKESFTRIDEEAIAKLAGSVNE